MIVLHNLQGEPFALNAELIERVEGHPEARVTLVTGTTYVVTEDLHEVIGRSREDRARVQALAFRLAAAAELPRDPELHLVTSDPGTEGPS